MNNVRWKIRLPALDQYRDGSTDNVFAATALILCIRDAIFDGEPPLSWRLHLQGASTILRKMDIHMSPITQERRQILTKLAISIQLRSMLPSSSTCGLDKMQHDVTAGACGVSETLIEILKDVRALRLERIALQSFEVNSGSSNMAPLWAALKGRCLGIIVRAESVVDHDAAMNEGSPAIHALYGRAAALQIYAGVLHLNFDDSGVHSLVDEAMMLLRAVTAGTEAELSVMLIFPIFTIGCLVTGEDDKALITWLLGRIATEHGKANATLACVVLGELWGRQAQRYGAAEQMDLEEWTTAKGWDLSLW